MKPEPEAIRALTEDELNARWAAMRDDMRPLSEEELEARARAMADDMRNVHAPDHRPTSGDEIGAIAVAPPRKASPSER